VFLYNSNLKRRKHLHENGDYQKQIYQQKDTSRLKILIFLSTKIEGSWKAEIKMKANLSHWTNLVELLTDLINLGWIEQHQAYGREIFKITDNGREVTIYVKEILSKEYPLKNLDIFKGISLDNFT
jgi:predicted transcriptional regulator